MCSQVEMGMMNPAGPRRAMEMRRSVTKYFTNQSDKCTPISDPGEPKYIAEVPLGHRVCHTDSDSRSRASHSAGERSQIPSRPVLTRASMKERVMPDAADRIGS